MCGWLTTTIQRYKINIKLTWLYEDKEIYKGHQNETIMIKITKNEIKMKTNNY